MSCKHGLSLFIHESEDSDQRLQLRDLVTPKGIRSSIYMSVLHFSIAVLSAYILL